MRCNRCGGMTIYQKFYGHCEHFLGWRCIVCGEIIDQVIIENRLEHNMKDRIGEIAGKKWAVMGERQRVHPSLR